MRQANHSDIAAIVELEYQLFPENNFNEVTVENELDVGVGWVEYEKDRLIGYLLARQDGELLDVIRLGVRIGYRRMGVGTKLLEESLKITRAVMLCVDKHNVTALKLYFRHSFRIVGVLADHGGWVMKRD
jgi:ribosomal protein S18 acetylase RimI-like enzyme